MTKKQKLVWAGLSFVLAGLCPTIFAVGGEFGWVHNPILPWMLDQLPHHPPFVLIIYGPQYLLYWAILFFAGNIVISLYNRKLHSDRVTGGSQRTPVLDDEGEQRSSSRGEGVVINATSGNVRLGPSGFHKFASDYLETVVLPVSERPYSPVPYFLCSRSIELVLKAFLLARRVPIDCLARSPLGHNLVNLLAKARSMGLDAHTSISNEDEGELVKANEYYSNKGFEYFEKSNVLKGYPDLPAFKTLHDFAARVIQDLGPYCKRVSVKDEGA